MTTPMKPYLSAMRSSPDKVEKLLKYENAKLKNQLIFTLPASQEVCGRLCPGCYAHKAQVRFPKALAYRERMLEASKQQSFVGRIVNEILSFKKPLKAVRIHESGDMYSQDYIDKWENIARQLPHVKFYAFTKQMKKFDFSKIMALKNVVIIDSLMHNGLNYDTADKIKELAKEKSSIICPATVLGNSISTCGVNCEHCWTKQAQSNGVLFIKH